MASKSPVWAKRLLAAVAMLINRGGRRRGGWLGIRGMGTELQVWRATSGGRSDLRKCNTVGPKDLSQKLGGGWHRCGKKRVALIWFAKLTWCANHGLAALLLLPHLLPPGSKAGPRLGGGTKKSNLPCGGARQEKQEIVLIQECPV